MVILVTLSAADSLGNKAISRVLSERIIREVASSVPYAAICRPRVPRYKTNDQLSEKRPSRKSTGIQPSSNLPSKIRLDSRGISR